MNWLDYEHMTKHKSKYLKIAALSVLIIHIGLMIANWGNWPAILGFGSSLVYACLTYYALYLLDDYQEKIEFSKKMEKTG